MNGVSRTSVATTSLLCPVLASSQWLLRTDWDPVTEDVSPHIISETWLNLCSISPLYPIIFLWPTSVLIHYVPDELLLHSTLGSIWAPSKNGDVGIDNAF